MHRAMQLALEIYARIPLIPRSLFLDVVNIEDNEPVGTGTLANGGHRTKVTLEQHAYGIFVCYLLATAPLECR